MNMRDYPTLHLDINYSKGMEIILQYLCLTEKTV